MSEVIVKKNLIIFRNAGDWHSIYTRILHDYGMGMAVRTRLRRELGLTYRIHQEWIEFDSTEGRPRKYCEEQVHVDFYNDAAQSWFQLKYMNRDCQIDQ